MEKKMETTIMGHIGVIYRVGDICRGYKVTATHNE